MKLSILPSYSTGPRVEFTLSSDNVNKLKSLMKFHFDYEIHSYYQDKIDEAYATFFAGDNDAINAYFKERANYDIESHYYFWAKINGLPAIEPISPLFLKIEKIKEETKKRLSELDAKLV